MIHPSVQLAATIYIHAAREAVWARFCRVPEWPQWRSDLAAAAWVEGQAWQEGAQFALNTAGGINTQPVLYLIRMVVPADTTVWEKNSASRDVVYSLQLVDQVGGCKVTLRSTFHGWGSLLKRLTGAREKAKLYTLLTELKDVVERPETRR